LEQCRSRVTELEHEIASYKTQLASLQEEKAHSTPVPVTKVVDLPVERNVQVPERTLVRDRLEDIQGVTPEMAQRLNEAGIATFADLGKQRPQKLKEILGNQLSQPGSEVEIVKQAQLRSGLIKKVDDLEVIVGIGPVIARMLNNAGIFTFAELGSLTAQDLQAIVGVRIERLADEEQILSQARQLAEAQDRGG
jgi:predicted flap endonuclease-1-like 5' DNA nuclease